MPDDPNLFTRIARSIGDTYTNLSQGRNYYGQPMFPPGTNATPVFIPGGPVGEAAGVIPRAGLQGLDVAPAARTVGLSSATPSPQVEPQPTSPVNTQAIPVKAPPAAIPRAEPLPEGQATMPVARQIAAKPAPPAEVPPVEQPVARSLAPTPTPAAAAPTPVPESPVNTAAIKTKPVEPPAEPLPAKQTPETAAHPELSPEPQQLSWAERASQNLQDTADAAMERIRQRGTLTGARAPSMPVDDFADLTLWGASKMAKGVVDSAKWSKEMVQEFGPQIKPKLKDLYDASQGKYEEYVNKFGDKLPNLQRLLTMYNKGIEGAKWYNATKDELDEVFGKDTEMFLRFLSATSPRNTVPGNVTQAVKAYMQWKHGQPFAATATQAGYLPVHIDLLNKAVQGEPFGGLKVSSFIKNLMGEEEPVTIDQWMAQAIYGRDSVTPAQYKFADYLVTQAAQKKGIPPREMQAAIWKTAREAAGKKGGGGSFESILRNKMMNDPDLAAAIKTAAAREAPPRP